MSSPLPTALRAAALGLALVGCEPESWLATLGMPAFREIGPAEALRLLGDPEVVRVEVRPGGGWDSPLGPAVVLGEEEELPDALVDGTERVLVVSPEETAGRRVSARLARAGIRGVSLVVADPRALALEDTRAQPPGG